MVKRLLSLVAVIALIPIAAGCSSQKVPAEAAIRAAETAFGAVQTEAAKYLPDQTKGISDAIAAAKDAAAKGDYQAALTAAQALPAKITELTSALAAKKAELTTTWTGLSAVLPSAVEAIQSRLNMLSKSKKLPAGLDKAKFEEAKTGLASITSTWTDATAAFGAGNLTDAIAKAGSVKTKAVEVMGLLGMQVPPALQGSPAK
jgi:seryl-tRNA synthetase